MLIVCAREGWPRETAISAEKLPSIGRYGILTRAFRHVRRHVRAPLLTQRRATLGPPA